MEEGSVLLDTVYPSNPVAKCGIDVHHPSAFAASLDGALSPMVGPGYVLLSKQFGVSVDDVASSFGSILLGLGCFMWVLKSRYVITLPKHIT